MNASTAIRTPDQRLRVFVSSTLGELSDERKAVRLAVEKLRLTAVMFELGARPYPPRELYRAYLAQSDVFVGIYWQRYGWVAPGEDVSGLEDEYRLADHMPRLLYIREPAPDRHPSLSQLIRRFASDDAASYRRFATADELMELVSDDLAILLSERFADRPAERWPFTAAAPAPPNELIGRSAELETVLELLERGTRLVTLTGTGGIGKTRIAVEVANTAAASRATSFVALDTATDADRALRTVADKVGARADGLRPALDVVVDHLRDNDLLLVLDNLEQIVEFEATIAALLERVPGLQFLATSRRAFRIRAEREVVVPPLRYPGPDDAEPENEPAVQLFLDRAAAVGAHFDLNIELANLVEICRQVEGVPLAIELAAARTRVLSPAQLLEQLRNRLSILVGGGPDVPRRQRTVRSTIDWSYELLDEEARALLARLSVFSGGWTLEAADAICSSPETGGVQDGVARLLDGSLVSLFSDQGGGPRFTMFETVRDYAAERLAEQGEVSTLDLRHLQYYRDLAELAQPSLCGPGQRQWVERLAPERPNIRKAVQTASAHHRYDQIVELAWDVIVLYFVVDAVDEPASWLEGIPEALDALDPLTTAKLRSLRALTRIHRGNYEGVRRDLEEALSVFNAARMDFESAVVLHQLGFVKYQLDGDAQEAASLLRRSSSLFAAIGHDWGVALAEAMLASVLAAEGDIGNAGVCAANSLTRARGIENEPQIAQALQQQAFLRVLERRESEAFEHINEAAALLRRNSLRTETTYFLDALACIALAGNDASTAADALTTADVERSRLRVAPWPSLATTIAGAMHDARLRLGDDAFAARQRSAATRELFETLDSTMKTVGSLVSKT